MREARNHCQHGAIQHGGSDKVTAGRMDVIRPTTSVMTSHPLSDTGQDVLYSLGSAVAPSYMPPPGVLLNPSERVIIHKTPCMHAGGCDRQQRYAQPRSIHPFTYLLDGTTPEPINNIVIRSPIHVMVRHRGITYTKLQITTAPVSGLSLTRTPKKAATYLVKITTYPELPHTQQPAKIPINVCVQSVFGGAGPT
jgi:hypothetical protein